MSSCKSPLRKESYSVAPDGYDLIFGYLLEAGQVNDCRYVCNSLVVRFAVLLCDVQLASLLACLVAGYLHGAFVDLRDLKAVSVLKKIKKQYILKILKYVLCNTSSLLHKKQNKLELKKNSLSLSNSKLMF